MFPASQNSDSQLCPHRPPKSATYSPILHRFFSSPFKRAFYLFQIKIHTKFPHKYPTPWTPRLNSQEASFPASRCFQAAEESLPKDELSWSTEAAGRKVSSDCWRTTCLGHCPGWLHVQVIALPSNAARTASPGPKSIRGHHITPQKAHTHCQPSLRSRAAD